MVIKALQRMTPMLLRAKTAFPAIAFFGGFMNFNFMLAGSASTNPMLFVIAVGLILAWKVSGYIGADYVLLRYIGTPWKGRSEAVTETAKPLAARRRLPICNCV